MPRLLVGLTVLTLIGGGGAAPVPTHLLPKEPPPYFPLRVGAKWVYQDGTKGVFGDIEWTLSVAAIERTDAGLLVTVTTHGADGETSLHQKVLVAPAGLEYVEGSRGKPASPQRMLKSPCVAGAQWESDYSTENFVQKWQCTALGTEEVEVPAGKFTAARVRTKLEWSPRGGKPFDTVSRSFVEWYAPGVGVVKIEDEHTGRPPWVLKSFIP